MTAPLEAMLPPGEAAHFLRRKLGPVCSWDDLLADARRWRRDEWHGLSVPFSIRCKGRPHYLLEDLERFVARAKAAGLAHSNPDDLGIVFVPLPH